MKKSTPQKILRQTRKNGIKPVYKITALVITVLFLTSLFFSDLIFKPKTEDEYMFKKEGGLVIADSAGTPKIRIDIEIADTDFDRQLGLMMRKSMEENQGMLFIFPAEEIQSFWMRNTFIPLDMLFINTDKKIITIRKNTQPLSDNNYTSTAPAQYVLEVNAGFTDKYNIREGDKISF
jgi:uncharacterized membrane protein (UPF0127 family)